jgi:hypothetical protein
LARVFATIIISCPDPVLMLDYGEQLVPGDTSIDCQDMIKRLQ